MARSVRRLREPPHHHGESAACTATLAVNAIGLEPRDDLLDGHGLADPADVTLGETANRDDADNGHADPAGEKRNFYRVAGARTT
jgi:hypothetical protein